MTVLLNLAKVNVSGAPGAGDITLGSTVGGWLSFSSAGATNGMAVVYNVLDGTAQATETATYTSAGPSLTGRSNTKSTTGSLLSLTSNAVITSVARAEDILNKTGDTMTGKLTTLATATGTAGFSLPAGTAPTSPVDGDVWTTTAGLFARINGVTVGPYSSGGAAFTLVATSGAITGSPTTVTFTGVNSEDLQININALVTSASAAMNLAVSLDNGATWTTTPANVVTPAFNTAARYTVISMTGLKSGYVTSYAGMLNTTTGKDAVTTASASSVTVLTINAGAQINGLRFSLNTAATITSGSIVLYGRG